MDHRDAPIQCHSILLTHGDRPLSLCARELSDATPSPATKTRLTDACDFSQRDGSKSPSLHSVPSTCSTQDFPPTPPANSSLRLPQVPSIPSIRHRTPQACDKCRERKTKCSGHRPTCLRCNSRGLSCKYSARETRIRSSLKSRSLVQTFTDRPLFSERKADPCGFPTPAHHSRMGSCQTSAFTRSPDDPKDLTMPVYATVPCMEEFAWNQLGDLSSFQIGTWPRFSLDLRSNSVDGMRKPPHMGLPLLDNGLVNVHSYDQIPHTLSVSINQEFNFDYSRLNRRVDANYLPSKGPGQELVAHSVSGCRGDRAFHPQITEGQNSPSFEQDPFSEMNISPGFVSLSNLRTPHGYDTHFLNGLGISC